MLYYRWHIGDFQKSTRGFSMLERGAYRDLLDVYYDSEKALPLDENELFELVGAYSSTEQRAIRKVLSRKWVKTDHGYINERACAEMLNQNEKRKKLAANGKIGGVQKHKQLLSATLANASQLPDGTKQILATLASHQPSAISQEPSAKSHQPVLPAGQAPTMEQALEWARDFSKANAWGLKIDDQMVREWHDDRSRTNWEIPRGQHLVPIADWQADLRDFTKWRLSGGGAAGGAKKEGGGFSPSGSKWEKPGVAVRLRTHPRLPEPPCEWRAVLKELYPAEDYPELKHDEVVWGLQPDVRRDLEAACRQRGLLAADWVQPGVPEN